jgi:tetratricopeptide (TPR) repeat protein
MSRLFEALNSLESTATGTGIQDTPFFEKAEPEPRNSNGTIKRQVIVLFLIISAVVVLGAVFYWLASTLNNQGTRQAGRIEHKVLTAESAVTGSDLEKSPVTSDEVEKKTSEYSPRKKQAAQMPGHPDPIQEKHSAHIYMNDSDKRPLSRNISSNMEKAESAAAEPSYGLGRIRIRPSSSRILNSRQKRLLYRAEILRKNGDIEDAAAIYEKIWRQTRNSQVGNNLAGVLILNRDLYKARSILNSIIKINPDDPDIKYNMSLLERLAAGKGR